MVFEFYLKLGPHQQGKIEYLNDQLDSIVQA
jgi:hypothetical protein